MLTQPLETLWNDMNLQEVLGAKGWKGARLESRTCCPSGSPGSDGWRDRDRLNFFTFPKWHQMCMIPSDWLWGCQTVESRQACSPCQTSSKFLTWVQTHLTERKAKNTSRLNCNNCNRCSMMPEPYISQWLGTVEWCWMERRKKCTALCGFSAKVRETTPDEMRQILASSASSSIRSNGINGKHELAVPDALEGVVQEMYCMQPQCL